MAFDELRGRAVLFGGGDEVSGTVRPTDTWEWNGQFWVPKKPEGANPTARIRHAMAFDSARRRVVLFGGRDKYGLTRETWEWDGASWTLAVPSGDRPSARAGHAMAYDSARQRTVLYGGGDDQTWEWDGSTWERKVPLGPTPHERWSHAMAFDSLRGRIVLFGGSFNQGEGYPYLQYTDTWEWDGATWEKKADTGPTSPQLAMAFDAVRGRTVAFDQAAGETWEWNGVEWTIVPPTAPSPPQTEYGPGCMAFDTARQTTVLFHPNGETWQWNGAAWTVQAASHDAPSYRIYHAMAFDSRRMRTVLFGGYNFGVVGLDDTWEWDGASWAPMTPVGSTPSGRSFPAMVFDSLRGRTVLYGGGGDGGTWEWDGVQWTQMSTPSSPPNVSGHAMAFDSARGRSVLFGGAWAGLYSNTWEWDGAQWTLMSPIGVIPAMRRFHAMAFDASRGRVVLFGGEGVQFEPLQDTWEWDGVQWRAMLPAGATPEARTGHAMVFDATRARVVLFGGQNSDGRELNDVWEWDGSTWLQKIPEGTVPSPRSFFAMAYDSSRKQSVVFGYERGAEVSHPTWLLSARGGPCTSAADSTTEFCVDGTSCESSVCSLCESCNGVASSGRCAPVILAEDDTCSAAQASLCDRRGACKRALGQAVQDASECASGFLVDGVCCETASCGSCETCNAAEKEIQDNDGRCGTQRAGTDKHDDCAVEAVSTCGQNGLCDGRGACQFYALGTACGDLLCRGRIATTQICTGAGYTAADAAASACIDAPRGQDCTPYVCVAPEGCKSSCVSDADCVETHRCQAGACVSKEQASCDGEHTLVAPNGAKTDCSPYVCSGATCSNSCASAADCAPLYVCNEGHACVAPDVRGDDQEKGGCACRFAQSRPSTAAASILAGLVLLLCARRRRAAPVVATASWNRTKDAMTATRQLVTAATPIAVSSPARSATIGNRV